MENIPAFLFCQTTNIKTPFFDNYRRSFVCQLLHFICKQHSLHQ